MTELARLVHGLGALRGTTAPRLLAVGWATVDIERTLEDLGVPGARPAADEPLLGARAWRVDAGAVTVLVLEPSTEGRLAAALARHGEGIRALYLGTDAQSTGIVSPTALGLPGRLLPHERPWGPFVIEVSVGG